mgnify:CR=1 FL=1
MNRYQFTDATAPAGVEPVVVEAINESVAREQFAAFFMDYESWAAAAADGLCDGITCEQVQPHIPVTPFPFQEVQDEGAGAALVAATGVQTLAQLTENLGALTTEAIGTLTPREIDVLSMDGIGQLGHLPGTEA